METFQTMSTLSKQHQNTYIQQLLLCLPPGYFHLQSSQNPHQQLINALEDISRNGLGDGMDDLFVQLAIDKKNWAEAQTPQQRFKLITSNLQKSIDQNKKKVNVQIDNYLTKGFTPSYKQNKPKDPFEWLKLKSKYPMCQQKLKAKLVQAISDSKNEKRIREKINNPQKPKVNLLDQSLIMDEYQKIKIEYKWTEEDQLLLIKNINSLKNKFNHTQFLKICKRFRFISTHQLQTLAAEQISRKLDQDNKVFLSRQFLLDKYYSTRQFLTEQQMRFILKTSPLLSKCVDKQFIKNAIKSIDYEDISKLELRIAEDIIARFDQIRKAVRESRKNFKQNKNTRIKQQIVEFQKKQELQIAREIAREQLSKHKIVKKSKSASSLKYMAENGQSKKVFIPLNKFHPPSGLFVKDCNQQCNDDLFNSYEVHYLQRDKMLKKYKNPPKNSISMMQFYTGGADCPTPQLSQQAISTICSIIKSHYYEKNLKMALDNYDISKCLSISGRTQQSVKSTVHTHKTMLDLDKKPKSFQKNADETEIAIKKKLIESKEKAKAALYINKLLTLSAQNNFTALKALNPKYTPQQVNTKDNKGNTPLYYASKHNNVEFITFLHESGADPSIPGQKEFTPLHFIFRTNNINLITKFLTSHITPNLNAVNNESKTPLAYCTYEVLTKLNLQEGVAVVQNRMMGFNNNALLTEAKLDPMRVASRANSTLLQQ